MNCSKQGIFFLGALLSLTVVSVGFAAATPVVAPAANTEATVTATKVTISQEKAVQIALNAYQGAKLINVKLYDTVYIVRIAVGQEKHYLKIGALSGRILQDSILNAQGKIERTLDLQATNNQAAPKATVAPAATPEQTVAPTATPSAAPTEEPTQAPVEASPAAVPDPTVSPDK